MSVDMHSATPGWNSVTADRDVRTADMDSVTADTDLMPMDTDPVTTVGDSVTVRKRLRRADPGGRTAFRKSRRASGGTIPR